MPNELFIAWWNVENLFDIENCPTRIEKLKKTLKKEVEGWTQAILDKKITQLGKIIKQMNNSQGPDLIGVCEIENENVMKLLANEIKNQQRNYQVIHHDCSDKREIDIGFIYDANKFDKGGYVSDDMVGLLHKGEYVMPRAQTHTVNLYVNNTVGNNADVNSIADAILRRIEGTTRF